MKYHLGTSADREFDGEQVHLSLAANPSHLEAVDPVVVGKVRAKQRQRGDKERRKVLGLLMHGDAAFGGQGIVAETFGLSDIKGYRTGGTIHVVVNNQIGFTTNPAATRTSRYPTEIAKMAQAPIFHVNGDDVEAVIHVARIATEFRHEFRLFHVNQEGIRLLLQLFIIWRILRETESFIILRLGRSGIKFEVEGEGGSTGADTYIPLQKSGTFFVHFS